MKKRITLILLLTVVLVIAAASACAVVFASADENVTIKVHFYNGDGQYDYPEWEGKTNIQWGSYYWIDTGRVSVNYLTEEDPVDDPDRGGFSRTMGDGTVNHGRCFEINLNAGESKAVLGGKKLGLIMVRTYKDELGYWTPYWCSNKGKDLSADRYIDVKGLTYEGGAYNVYIIAGDKNNYTTLRQAKSAFERIESANFDDFNNLILQTTKPIDSTTDVKIFKVTDLKNAPDGELLTTVHASTFWNEGLNAKVSGLGLGDSFDWNADYQILIEDVSPFRTSATKTRLFLSDKFKSECELPPAEEMTLGVTYTKARTTFRIWAPISTNVAVNFYRTGNELDFSLLRPQEDMTRKEKGVWELTVDEDLNGVYYTYSNWVTLGEPVETVDVYATAVGVNGMRSMVCDLSATDPDGWDEDLAKAKAIRNDKSDTGVIWEVHVRDFSISPDSGMTYKGMYLAFTEQDTKVKGSNLNSGVAYLKDLGVSYVHLNPVFDFATVDEEYINNTDYTTKQNWGYDPKNYNVPEGSYATDADNGEVRIKEFKQMVAALHDAGIGVIMDVVYNHTATADSYLEKSVPGYYYRQALDGHWNGSSMDYTMGTFNKIAWTTNNLGAYNLSDGSGCSNETASERAMFRRYMVDSLVYWAKEYHIDGFRFDLMAIHDTTTMQSIRIALNNLYADGNGQKILLYGEPWAAADLGLDGAKSAGFDSLDDQEMLGIRVFNSSIREGVKGDNGWGDRAPSQGYVQGNYGEQDRIKAGLNGYIAGQKGGNSHAINYTTSHDNYTLWDQLIVTTVGERTPTLYTEPNNVLIRKNMMAATFIMTGRGMSFMLAGEEIGRTKYGNHNSYNAQDKVNAFDYNRQKEFAALYDWYKGLIALRNAFPSFARGSREATIYSAGADDGCICYLFDKEGADAYNRVYVLTNPRAFSQTLAIEGNWQVLADENGFQTGTMQAASGSVTLPAFSTYILVQ